MLRPFDRPVQLSRAALPDAKAARASAPPDTSTVQLLARFRIPTRTPPTQQHPQRQSAQNDKDQRAELARLHRLPGQHCNRPKQHQRDPCLAPGHLLTEAQTTRSCWIPAVFRHAANFWCTGEDSNLRTSLGRADLQSAAINRSATCARFQPLARASTRTCDPIRTTLRHKAREDEGKEETTEWMSQNESPESLQIFDDPCVRLRTGAGEGT